MFVIKLLDLIFYQLLLSLHMFSSFVRKYPAVITVVPLALGIVICYYTGLRVTLLPHGFYIPSLILLVIVIIFVYRGISKSELHLFSYIVLLVLYGVFSLQLNYFNTGGNEIPGLINKLNNKKSVITGIISEQPEIKDDRIRLLIKSTGVNDFGYSGNVLATVYRNKYEDNILNGYKYGDIVKITGQLEKLPHQRNPGEFDYGEYLKLHDINAVFISFGYENIEPIGYYEQNFFKSRVIYPVKDYSIQVIDKLIGGDEGEYLKGLVLGEKSNISRELKENFVNAGVAHIIAVSGLNVAYVIIIIWGALIFIPVKHNYKILFTLLILFLYMNLTGNSPSIIRATIMAGVFLLSQVVERKPNIYNIIAAAGLVILLIDPKQLFDAGFILSFSAILSIVIIYPKLEKLFKGFIWYKNLDNERLSGKGIKAVITLFLGTFAAQIGTLPVTAIMFKKVSIISLAANLFAIPLSNIALGLGFIMIIASTFSMWLASVFASLNSFLLFIQLAAIEACAKLDFAFVETYFVDKFMFVSYYIILILLLTVTRQNLKARLVIVIMITLNFFVWKSVFDKTDMAEVTYIDTGSSNSTLIKMPLGTSILFNAGSSTQKYTSAERNIIPYLKTQGIHNLDLLVMTTVNSNEFKSMKYLIDNFQVNRILVPVYYKPLFTDKHIASTFKQSNIEFIDNSQIINKNGKFRIYLYYDSNYTGESILARFVYGSQEFLFNDSYSLNEDLANTLLLQTFEGTQVLKASGSGSFDYTSTEFIAKTNPEFVVISKSRNDRKKLNSDVFTETLDNFGVNVLKTNDNGAVIFETDGNITGRVEW